jgi:hypothetical protein
MAFASGVTVAIRKFRRDDARDSGRSRYLFTPLQEIEDADGDIQRMETDMEIAME